jgi:transposase
LVDTTIEPKVASALEVSMRNKRRKFSREFKIEALRLVEESGRPLTQVAMELGIRADLLGNWRRQLSEKGDGRAFPGGPVTLSAVEEENRRLKKELERVEQERDILKKAVAYFARESR